MEFKNVDYSLWLLLFSNIATIYFAVTEGWSLLALMFVYWSQSVIIGIFTFLKIIVLKDSEILVQKEEPGERPAIGAGLPIREVKYYQAFFFAFHYGFFHLGYLFFIVIAAIVGSSHGIEATYFIPAQGGIEAIVRELPMMIVAICLFFINHLTSFIQYLKAPKKDMNLNDIGYFPYARIVPMHLTIVTGAQLQGIALPFFLILKTIADVGMHIIEHKND